MAKKLTDKEREIKNELTEIGRQLYLYDYDYIAERQYLYNQLNALQDIIVREKLNINWKEIIPEWNCEGQKIW